MREPSLRPERSASANSATSAGEMYFIYFHSFVKSDFELRTLLLLNPACFYTVLFSYCRFLCGDYNDINPKS